jgi:hypothetical protein
MKKFILFVTIFVANFLFSQEKYNLPPGSVLKSKSSVEDTYSYKLNFLNDASVVDKNQNFLESISKDELEEMKILSPNKYAYYIEAKEFYTNLSPKVKNTFSVKELWEIYVFDQEFKSKLQNIK